MDDAVRMFNTGAGADRVARALKITVPEVYRRVMEYKKDQERNAEQKAAQQVANSRRD